MYIYNIGKKIKSATVVVFIIGVLFTLYCGIDLIKSGIKIIHYGGGWIIFCGLVALVLGLISSGLMALLCYGFGELIEKVKDLASSVQKISDSNISMSSAEREKIEKEIMESLLKKGVITQEEYNKSFVGN